MPEKMFGPHFFPHGVTRNTPLFLPGTMGNDKGADTDGVVLGEVLKDAVGKAFVDDGAGAFTDETTDINDAGADDVTTITADIETAIYIGHTATQFFGLKITVGTAGAGTYVEPTNARWEYYDGTAWAALTVSRKGNIDLKAAETNFLLFEPPAAWAKTAVNGTTAYWVRFRKITAAGTVTTAPLLTQAWLMLLKPTTATLGPMVPPGKLTEVNFASRVKSATNADSVFLLVDLISGKFKKITYTKAKIAHTVTGVNFVLGDGDHHLAVVQIEEDGATEYADVLMNLYFE